MFFDPLAALDFDDLIDRDPAYGTFKDCIIWFEQLIAGEEERFASLADVFLDNHLYDEDMIKVICRYLYYYKYI